MVTPEQPSCLQERTTLVLDTADVPNVVALLDSDGSRRTMRIVSTLLDQLCARLLQHMNAIEPQLLAAAIGAANSVASATATATENDADVVASEPSSVATAEVDSSAAVDPVTGSVAGGSVVAMTNQRCELCGKVCKNKSGYSRHMLKSHRGYAAAPQEDPDEQHTTPQPQQQPQPQPQPQQPPHHNPVWDEDDVESEDAPIESVRVRHGRDVSDDEETDSSDQSPAATSLRSAPL